MRIRSATFVISNAKVSKCPDHNLPEYAFIGRSNVGKSSLINALCLQKGLAKTSSKPGKTRLINHFLINNQWYLVDLPGYGYAKASKTEKKIFQRLITAYFNKRRQLVNTFLLIDIRHNALPIDLDFMRWMGENYTPFSIVFTKADKLKQDEVHANVKAYKAALLEANWEKSPPIFITSSLKKEGREELLASIETINEEMFGL